jgi:hypothetical protein
VEPGRDELRGVADLAGQRGERNELRVQGLVLGLE